ncbi:uncharacterized protein LOC133034304 [Cannabis sativa]|uniref:uncharacterized protein LOC133034304 n=1 Tax=Cannabis sativa TaxID=3483 RepID=UPI0029CA118A|nr:uncharacterized protein LOC133034304 [Cannabis sativa]
MDVFLRPLVDELKELWNNGVPMRDSSTNSMFTMRAALLWTVNDFPARGSLSGWSGQGYKACPTRNEDTTSIRVIRKTSYVGHKRFLPSNRVMRRDTQFDGKVARRPPPRRFTCEEILSQVNALEPQIPGHHEDFGGVKRRRVVETSNWKEKKSIFYELEYWSTNILKHNIDVMHVKKNMCDSLLGTILDNDKSKDTTNARHDLKKMGIRKLLWIYEDENGRLMKLDAPYVLTREKRQLFLGNKARPEGSIAEGYVVDEEVTFCSMYFKGCETRFNHLDQNEDAPSVSRYLSVFNSQSRPLTNRIIKPLNRISREKVECEHLEKIRHEYPNSNHDVLHRQTFRPWFHKKFIATERDKKRKTQNSGVNVARTEGFDYYGILEDVITISYIGAYTITLFECKWYNTNPIRKKTITENNITSINIRGFWYQDEPYILANQAKQVFYLEDPLRGRDWNVVEDISHRKIWDINDNKDETDVDVVNDSNSSNFVLTVDLGELILQSNEPPVIVESTDKLVDSEKENNEHD